MLYHSSRSPYVRKVRVMAHELDLAERLELVDVTPETIIDAVRPDNPLAQIPTLVLKDGTVLYDSPVICDYLDTLHDGAPLIPREGPARWTALTQQAMGDAVLDQAIAVYMERHRPAEQRNDAMLTRRRDRVVRCLKALDEDAATLREAVTIGPIAVACALGYLESRLGDEVKRSDYPALDGWYAAFAERPSMLATRHPDPA